jgi:DMSO/TMAO reductase YedYZ heme-binding membrane subunit
MTDQLWWYTARSGGFVAWGLLAASVLWGLSISTKATGKRVRPNWMLDLHRFLGGVAVVFTAVHVVAIMADSYVNFGPSDVLVPFASAWNPTAVAWGIVAMYLLVAIEVSSLLRKRIPKKAWRAIHFASFPLFIFSTVHAFAAGTDTSGTIFIATAAVVSFAVVILTIRRVNQARRPTTRRPVVSATSTLLPPPVAGAWRIDDPGLPAPPQRELVETGQSR